MPETRHLKWTPGNGTVYDILLTKTDDTYMGHEAGTLVATISNYPRPIAMFLSPDADHLHYTYVMEKTGLGIADACCVAEMLAAATGRTAGVTSEPWYRQSVKNPFVL